MSAEAIQQPEVLPPQPKCPWCKQVWAGLGVAVSDGIAAFWHDVPHCMKIIGFQILAVRPQKPSLVQVPQPQVKLS